MQRSLRTTSGKTLQLKLAANARLGAGGQGQVFAATLSGERVAVKLVPAMDVQRLAALQALQGRCGAVATLPLELLASDSTGSN